MISPFKKYISGAPTNLEVQLQRCNEPWYCDNIDDTLARYNDFTEYVRQNNGFPIRVTITGESGSGKKTFMSRCFKYLTEKLQQGFDDIIIYDYDPPAGEDKSVIVNTVLSKIQKKFKISETIEAANIGERWCPEQRCLIISMHNCSSDVISAVMDALSLSCVHILAACTNVSDAKTISRKLPDECHPIKHLPLGYVCFDSVAAFIQHVIEEKRLSDDDAIFSVDQEGLNFIVGKLLRADGLHASMHNVCSKMDRLCEFAIKETQQEKTESETTYEINKELILEFMASEWGNN